MILVNILGLSDSSAKYRTEVRAQLQSVIAKVLVRDEQEVVVRLASDPSRGAVTPSPQDTDLQQKWSLISIVAYFTPETCAERGASIQTRGQIIGGCQRYSESVATKQPGMPRRIITVYDLYLLGRSGFSRIKYIGKGTTDAIGQIFAHDNIPW